MSKPWSLTDVRHNHRMAKPPRKPTEARADDPFPVWIPPCLPTLVERPPEGGQWQQEIKWDGYRVSAYLDAGVATIRTRNGHDWTHRFPAIADAIAALPIHNAAFDGEAVVLDDMGRSSFPALQQALGTGGRGPGKRTAHEAVLYCFDLLYLDGHDLRLWSLENRRDALLGIIGEAGPVLLYSQAFESTGADLFAAAQTNELEGIVSKRKDLPYTSGRREDWLKTKCVQDGTFVVIGYQPGSMAGSLGAVHVAEEQAARCATSALSARASRARPLWGCNGGSTRSASRRRRSWA